jgi:hypothetical protein
MLSPEQGHSPNTSVPALSKRFLALAVGAILFVFFIPWKQQSFAPQGKLVYPLELPRPLTWLHIPKTATSFANTLMHAACPELNKSVQLVAGGPHLHFPPPCMHGVFASADEVQRTKCNRSPRQCFGYHHSLTAKDDEFRVATLLRSPLRRAASWYWHTVFFSNKSSFSEATEADMCADEVRLKAFAMQSKMVLGWHLYGNLQISNLVAKKVGRAACDRIRKFGFVGITNLYNATVCLFHYTFGTKPLPFEWENVRPGSYYEHHSALQKADCLGNEADNILFTCAVELFLQRIKTTPCAALLNPAEDLDLPEANRMLQSVVSALPFPSGFPSGQFFEQ